MAPSSLQTRRISELPDSSKSSSVTVSPEKSKNCAPRWFKVSEQSRVYKLQLLVDSKLGYSGIKLMALLVSRHTHQHRDQSCTSWSWYPNPRRACLRREQAAGWVACRSVFPRHTAHRTLRTRIRPIRSPLWFSEK